MKHEKSRQTLTTIAAASNVAAHVLRAVSGNLIASRVQGNDLTDEVVERILVAVIQRKFAHHLRTS